MRIGEPFNPARQSCGFFPQNLVSRLPGFVILQTRRKFSFGHKNLFDLLVRLQVKNGECCPGFKWLAEEALGVSLRSVKMLVQDLEAFGLIRHILRRGREKGGRHLVNKYEFLWHAIFEVQNLAVMKCKNGGVEVQESATLKCKNRHALYSEEYNSENQQQASQPNSALDELAEEILGLVNGYPHPAGRWIEGCSPVGMTDDALLVAVTGAARDRGLTAGDVAQIWARKAQSISRRANQRGVEDPAAYFRKAILEELARAIPSTSPIPPSETILAREDLDAIQAPPDLAHSEPPIEFDQRPLSPPEGSCRPAGRDHDPVAVLSIETRKHLAAARKVYPFASLENLLECIKESGASVAAERSQGLRSPSTPERPAASNYGKTDDWKNGGLPRAGDLIAQDIRARIAGAA